MWIDPFSMSGMDRAVEMLLDAARSGGPVAIYGDFDVDGITGTAILCQAVTALGARPVPHLPNRLTDGHGLHESALRELAGSGASLLITVDCGTTAFAEVEFAKSLGMDVIVTDHHLAPDGVPFDTVVLNPSLPGRYPYQGLTGAGVALKLATASLMRAGRPLPKSLIELAALGTVADLGPLTGENRYIAGRGLAAIRTTSSPGLRALAARAGEDLQNLGIRDLSFGLIPRLNSAGRLEDPKVSLRLLTTTDVAEATESADKLEHLNAERRRLMLQAIEEAETMVTSKGMGTQPAIVVHSPEWHPGVLGLVAGRLADRYGRPIVAATSADGMARASARGPEGSAVMDAIIATGLPFAKCGGHATAAGFSLDEKLLQQFAEDFPAKVTEARSVEQPERAIEYECEMAFSDISHDNYSFISALGPFGTGNPVPMFLTRRVRAIKTRKVGRTQDHLKMRVLSGGVEIDAIGFGLASKAAETDGSIDLVYSLDINEWNGQRRLELKVEDLRASA